MPSPAMPICTAFLPKVSTSLGIVHGSREHLLRVCLGAGMARSETLLFFTILQRFYLLLVGSPSNKDLTLQCTGLGSGPSAFQLHLVAHRGQAQPLSGSLTLRPPYPLLNKGPELHADGVMSLPKRDRESDVCSSEVNFYFLADRTFTPMLLPAPFILPKQRQPSPKGAKAKGVGSHFTFQAGGVGGLGDTPSPPANLCQQEAMTQLNPKSCILVGGGNAPFQLSTPERGTTRQGKTQAPSSNNNSTGPCPSHNPSPYHRVAQVSPLLGPQ